MFARYAFVVLVIRCYLPTAFRTTLPAKNRDPLGNTLEMQFSPLFAHDPNLHANRLCWPELTCDEQIEAFPVEVDAVASGDGIVCFPYPFLDQVAGTLNKDAFMCFRNQMGNG